MAVRHRSKLEYIKQRPARVNEWVDVDVILACGRLLCAPQTGPQLDTSTMPEYQYKSLNDLVHINHDLANEPGFTLYDKVSPSKFFNNPSIVTEQWSHMEFHRFIPWAKDGIVRNTSGAPWNKYYYGGHHPDHLNDGHLWCVDAPIEVNIISDFNSSALRERPGRGSVLDLPIAAPTLDHFDEESLKYCSFETAFGRAIEASILSGSPEPFQVSLQPSTALSLLSLYGDKIFPQGAEGIEVRNMTDTVVENFSKKSRRGEVINNPMDSFSQVLLAVPPEGSSDLSWFYEVDTSNCTALPFLHCHRHPQVHYIPASPFQAGIDSAYENYIADWKKWVRVANAYYGNPAHGQGQKQGQMPHYFGPGIRLRFRARAVSDATSSAVPLKVLNQSLSEFEPVAPIDSHLRDEAIAGVKERTKGEELNLPVTLLEAQSTIAMVANRLTDLAQILSAFKRGDFSRLSRKGQKRMSRIKDGADRASSAWLEYNYGWKPLVSDIQAGIKLLGGIEFSPRQTYRDLRVAGPREVYTDLSVFSDPSNLIVTGNSSYRAGELNSVRLENIVGERLSLSRFASNVWELIPYSFVADWFINIGSYLEELDGSATFESLSAWLTEEHSATITGLSGFSTDAGTEKYFITYLAKQKFRNPIEPTTHFSAQLPSGWFEPITGAALILQRLLK